MTKIRNHVFALALLAIAGCNSKVPDPNAWTLEATLASLNLESPASDAMTNFSKGDLRLIGVNSFTCSLPGASVQVQEELAQKNGVHCLEGTSDAGSRQLNEQAAAYALRYNVALVKLVRR